MGKGIRWWDDWFCAATSRSLSAHGQQLEENVLLLKMVLGLGT